MSWDLLKKEALLIDGSMMSEVAVENGGSPARSIPGFLDSSLRLRELLSLAFSSSTDCRGDLRQKFHFAFARLRGPLPLAAPESSPQDFPWRWRVRFLNAPRSH